jgi:hypothetical protein
MYSSESSLDSNFLLLVAIIDMVSSAIMGGVIALVIGKIEA